MQELRDVNEQLVLAALEAQVAAERAEEARQQVARAAERDALTGLANRRLLSSRFEQAAALEQRRGLRLAVLFLDIDNFKQVNDTLGHTLGDAVLRHVAACLTAVMRASDTLCRYGGDEFVLLLTDLTEPDAAGDIAAKLLATLGMPVTYGEHVVRLSGSIGISTFPDDGTDLATLIENADKAMYRAKRCGLGGYSYYATFVQDGAAGPLQTRAALAPVLHAEASVAASERRMGAMREANEQLVLAALSAQALQAYAQDASDRQQEFMGMLAHELRNPLAPMLNVAAMLAGAHSDTMNVPRLQAIIERQVVHMARLIDDLLDVSRIASGKLRLDMQRADLLVIVAEAIEACRPAMDVRLQAFSTQLPLLPVSVDADPLRLVQVLSNLLDNASKYTPKGGSIRLTVTVRDADVVIVVKDSGIGIPAESLPHIFELFAQDPHATGFNGAGLGIGLTVVRELVEAHGGTVLARAGADGVGSEFVVTLPRAAGGHESP